MKFKRTSKLEYKTRAANAKVTNMHIKKRN